MPVLNSDIARNLEKLADLHSYERARAYAVCG
jgi:hypothetical protein